MVSSLVYDKHKGFLMIRKHFYLPIKQIERLKQMAKDKGIPLSELVRRIFDTHLENSDRRERERERHDKSI